MDETGTTGPVSERTIAAAGYALDRAGLDRRFDDIMFRPETQETVIVRTLLDLIDYAHASAEDLASLTENDCIQLDAVMEALEGITTGNNLDSSTLSPQAQRLVRRMTGLSDSH